MNRVRQIVIAILVFAGAAAAAFAFAAQSSHATLENTLVFDGALVISADDARPMIAHLREFDARTGRTIAVATVRSLDGETVEQYAAELLGSKWGLYNAKPDQRVLLLVAPNERKVRIEVGRELQQYVPPQLAKAIVDEKIIPRFKQRDFAGGINAGLYALTEQLARDPGEATAIAQAADAAAAAERDAPLFGGNWQSPLKSLLWTLLLMGFWAWWRRDGQQLREWLQRLRG